MTAIDKQFLRMGKAGSSILNTHGLDLVINKQSPTSATGAGTGAQAGTNNAAGGDHFSEIKNQSPYWTSSGGGTVEDKFSSLVHQDASGGNMPTSNHERKVDVENSYGLTNSFGAAPKPLGASNLQHSPSQEMMPSSGGIGQAQPYGVSPG